MLALLGTQPQQGILCCTQFFLGHARFVQAALQFLLGSFGEGTLRFHQPLRQLSGRQRTLSPDTAQAFPGLKQIDLRSTGLTCEEYETVRAWFPGAQILWDIPFQGEYFDMDTDSLTLTSLEVVLSGVLLKLPFLKRILSVRPAILVRNGKPDSAAMASVRVSAEELLSQLRQKDVTDLDEVEYAILEPNGQISIVKKTAQREATASDLGLTPEERGMMHLLVCDGKIHRRNLALAGWDEAKLFGELTRRKLEISDVFLMLADDGGRVALYPREAA
jgi:uncharacterized membrane protein YcaP (DUF421 family)